MKGNNIFIVILLAGLGFSVYYFDLIDKLKTLPDKSPERDSLTAHVEKRPQKISKGKGKFNRPRKHNPYYHLENYAFNTPKSKTNTISDLAFYLSKGASNEYGKARLAYAWVAKHINYDDRGYNTGDYSDLSAEGVLKSRRAVCEGFSNLYKALCDSMGLNAIKISGYAKGYGYTNGSKFSETDHAWNAVKINGKWQLVDVTWGEGYGKTVNGKLKSIKKYDPYWFATDPYEFIFKHYPEIKSLQFISSPITKEQFEQLIVVDDDIFQLGGSSKSIFYKALNDINYAVPQAWAQDYDLFLTELELDQNLSPSKEYKFKVKCNENIDVAFINNKNWTYLKKEDGYYTGLIHPQNGELTLNVKLKGFENSYSTILRYEVK
jgi:transglutaminase-like putative cysteine protease